VKRKLVVFLVAAFIAEALLICGFVAVHQARFQESYRWDWQQFTALSTIRHDEGGLPLGTDFYEVWALRPVPTRQSNEEIENYERSAAWINDAYLTDYLGRISVMFMKTYGYGIDIQYEILLQTEDALVYRLYDDSRHTWQIWVSRPDGVCPSVAVYKGVAE
jgi:hypothetical protein